MLEAVKQGGLAADAHDADDAGVLVAAVKQGGSQLMLVMLMMLTCLWRQGGLAADAHDADDAGVLVAVKQRGLATDAHDADDAHALVAVRGACS